MRTKYIKPEIRIEEIVVEKIIATSVPFGQDVENATTDIRDRRGSWGDLWK